MHFGDLQEHYDCLPVVRKYAELKGVPVEELFAHLLNCFLEHHMFSELERREVPEEQAPNLVSELVKITNRLKIDGKSYFPRSMLDSMLQRVTAQQMMHAYQAELHRQPDKVQEIDMRTGRPLHEALARRALKDEALVLILRESVEEAERVVRAGRVEEDA